MIVIVPCCGESQRFNGTKKQFLRAPNGLWLPVFSASGIKGARKIYYTYIAEDFFHSIASKKLVWGGGLCLLEHRTESQVQTIVDTIKSLGITHEGIYIKDCDNYFESYVGINTVAVKHTLNAKFKLHNKGFTLADEAGKVIKIAERVEISKYINVGGYGFASAEMFLHYSQGCKYISEVISSCIKDGVTFTVSHCDNYIDYGEQDDFDNFLKTYNED